MILSFKEQFKQPILEGTKKHTIRLDPSNRWSRGRLIHFATGVRTKNYNCFKEGRCHSVQKIKIVHDKKFNCALVTIDGRSEWSNHYLVKQIAKNDGFDSVEDFFKWFDKDFEGKIIHWTGLKY